MMMTKIIWGITIEIAKTTNFHDINQLIGNGCGLVYRYQQIVGVRTEMTVMKRVGLHEVF